MTKAHVLDATFNQFLDKAIQAVRAELDRVTERLNAEDSAIREASRGIQNDDAYRECLGYCDFINQKQANYNASALATIKALETQRK